MNHPFRKQNKIIGQLFCGSFNILICAWINFVFIVWMNVLIDFYNHIFFLFVGMMWASMRDEKNYIWNKRMWIEIDGFAHIQYIFFLLVYIIEKFRDWFYRFFAYWMSLWIFHNVKCAMWIYVFAMKNPIWHSVRVEVGSMHIQ